MKILIAPDDLDSYKAFLEEAASTLDNLEEKILSLGDGEDPGLVDELFRGLHSMKGVASFLGLAAIQKLSHDLESVFDSIRQGRIRTGPDLVNGCLAKVDLLNAMIGDLSQAMAVKSPQPQGGFEVELKDWPDPAEAPFHAARPASGPAEEGAPAGEGLALPELRADFQKQSLEQMDEIELHVLNLARNPADQEALGETFRLMHSFKGACGFLGFADMERLGHKLESAMEACQESGEPVGKALLESALRCTDAFRMGIADAGRGGEGRMERGAALAAELDRLAGPLPATEAGEGRSAGEAAPEIAPAEGVPPSSKASAPEREAARAKGGAAEARKDLRVDIAKLDVLLDLVGELVIASSIVGNHPDLGQVEHENFDKAAHHMTGIVNDLQKVVLGLRMVPVENVFKKMSRLVHDQATKSGKKVRLELRGEKTEVDKNIAELIADPLVHMIRNAIDHGIEPPEERTAAGKEAAGTVVLEAKQDGSDIAIVLSDDGRGLNREKILAKAVEKGLLRDPKAELRDEDIFQFIFHPGFSTAERVTSTSGRGVGMDVVKNNIEKLKGKIIIHSQPGRGTTVDLRLPLTLSILEGMQVRVGEARSILPLTAVKETLSPDPERVTRTGEGLEVYHLRGKLYPILRLRDLHRIPGGRTVLREGVLLLIEARESAFCLFVDELLGMQQTVVKALPAFLGNVAGASGCSILSNGEICLILDVEALHAARGASRPTGAPRDVPEAAHA